VVVLVKKPDDDRPARALADRLHEALRDVTQADRFVTAARAMATGGLEVVAEKVPAVAADGRVTADDSPPDRPPMVVEYARAANAIAAPGDKSPVVKSPFGYHVILLVERIPERRVPLERRRLELGGDVLVRRAKRELTHLLESLRRQSPPEVDRASADLTSRVQVRR
jgi:peptidyl-prolyl cis-trans isomerase C